MAGDVPSAPFVSRIGVEPLNAVFPIENHDEAYYVWRNAGFRNRTLVHIDAHHDMGWVDDDAGINIGNFIYPALKRDLLQEVFWVVPDATFQDAKSLKPVHRHLRHIVKEYPRTVVVEDLQVTATVLNKKLTICPLRLLPALREPVLLDIDVDYLVIPKVSYGKKTDNHDWRPWCWPDDFVDQLRARGLWSDLVTIAYSVEGGYTPLQWKYLGDELALRLKEPLGMGTHMTGMCCIRQGSEAEQRGHTAIAESKYREAYKLLPRSAAAPYRLARLLVSLGRIEESRQVFGEAVRLDASYKGAYSSSGFYCLWSGKFAAAEREFRHLLSLDPIDSYSQLGLGLLAQERMQWNEAEQHFRAALALDNCLLDAQRALGDVLANLGRRKEAILAWEQALKLGLTGHKPLRAPIVSYAPENASYDFKSCQRLVDPWHCATHARLARLYLQEGATTKAISAIRFSLAGGFDSVRLRLQLAYLYWKQGQWGILAVQICQVIKMMPRAISARGARVIERVGKGVGRCIWTTL
jgi:tetratricopeptide (TPR) repeat protein